MKLSLKKTTALIGTVLIASSLAVASTAFAKKELRFAHVYEVKTPYHEAALRAAEEVEKKTDGRYAIKVFPASSLGKEQAINEGISLGTIDIIYTGCGFASRSFGPIGISDYPFTMRGYPHWKAYTESDLFAELATVEKKTVKPFYQQDQFVWTLKWTHIHLFGMSMIFIFVGAITIWLDAGSVLRSWLVLLPFIGVLVDILAMWLKAFVSPAFFWLHVPGGGLFAIVFGYVALRALWEMWLKPRI